MRRWCQPRSRPSHFCNSRPRFQDVTLLVGQQDVTGFPSRDALLQPRACQKPLRVQRDLMLKYRHLCSWQAAYLGCA